MLVLTLIQEWTPLDSTNSIEILKVSIRPKSHHTQSTELYILDSSVDAASLLISAYLPSVGDNC
jgi:hypothetical protein